MKLINVPKLMRKVKHSHKKRLRDRLIRLRQEQLRQLGVRLR